jgi:hypothetical protein
MLIGKNYPLISKKTPYLTHTERNLIDIFEDTRIDRRIADLVETNYVTELQAITFLLCYKTTPTYHKDIAQLIIKFII